MGLTTVQSYCAACDTILDRHVVDDLKLIATTKYVVKGFKSNWQGSRGYQISPPVTQLFAKVTAATVNAIASAVRSLFTMFVYIAGALWRMRLSYDGKIHALRYVTLSMRRLSHAPYSPLRVNMTSSTKPEVHNILHCRQRRTETQPQV